MKTRTLLTLGATTITLAACGDDGSGRDDAASPRERAQEGALKFARCMREHGVNIPDPQVGEGGLVRIGPGPGAGPGKGPNLDDAKTREAHEACEEHLELGGEAPDDAVLAEHRDAFVAYARCMRAEGVNVPDPGPEGGLMFRAGDPNSTDPRSPAFRRADEACHKHLAAVDAELEEKGLE